MMVRIEGAVGAVLAGMVLVGLVGCNSGSSNGNSNSGGGTLQSGVPVNGKVDFDAWKHYSINVPDNATGLRVTMDITSADGDVDLIVNHGTPADAETWGNHEEDCWDWAVPDAPAVCDSNGGFVLQSGTYHVAAWGLHQPSSDYRLVATVTTGNSRSSARVDAEGVAARQIAYRYLKQQRGMMVSAGVKKENFAYPQSGIVLVDKGDERFRFYFGADAATPAVLSIDNNGNWVNYYSWEEFEAEMSTQSGKWGR